MEDAGGRYIEAAKATFPARPPSRRPEDRDRLRQRRRLPGGARGAVGTWRRRGAVGVEPDGFNINRGCGSTVPEFLCGEVRRHGAHLGLALDGDADRLVLSDEHGNLIDGDQILALIARSWSESGRLKGDGIVATVMSNLGLERFLAARGLGLHRTAVGDRYVVEKMRADGFNVGGEQSGHMILSDYATTGDGLLAACRCWRCWSKTAAPPARSASCSRRCRKTLRSVPFYGKWPLEAPPLRAAIVAAERRWRAPAAC